MPRYAVTYYDSRGKKHYEFCYADNAAEAKQKVKASSVTVEGMGGNYRTVARVGKAERVG